MSTVIIMSEEIIIDVSASLDDACLVYENAKAEGKLAKYVANNGYPVAINPDDVIMICEDED